MPARKSGFLLFNGILSSGISIAAKWKERHPHDGRSENYVTKIGVIKQFCEFTFSITIYMSFRGGAGMDHKITSSVLQYLLDNSFSSKAEMAREFDMDERYLQRLIKHAEHTKGGGTVKLWTC